MGPVVKEAASGDEEENEATDMTSRYENEFPAEDVFEDLIRQAEKTTTEPEESSIATQQQETNITNEQRERMLHNRRMAEERRKARQLEKETEKLIDQPVNVLVYDEEETEEPITFINDKENSECNQISDHDQPSSQVYEPLRKGADVDSDVMQIVVESESQG